MQIVDMANLSTGQAHQYCVRGLGGPLSVTLVWHDYPAAVSARKALVNDLDLTIRAAGLNGISLLVRHLSLSAGYLCAHYMIAQHVWSFKSASRVCLKLFTRL